MITVLYGFSSGELTEKSLVWVKVRWSEKGSENGVYEKKKKRKRC